jgi:hypothetical protein
MQMEVSRLRMPIEEASHSPLLCSDEVEGGQPGVKLKNDWYECFSQMEQKEREGIDFRRLVIDRGSAIAVLAPHGGEIEPHTSTIARAIASDTLSLYLFEGLRSHRDHCELHIDAFVLLTELTPARTELLRLCQYDRPRAFSELAKHIDLAADQFQLSADLLAEVEGGSGAVEMSDEQRFVAISTALLDRSGGGVSLTEGAKMLGTTRQALHKRVKLGSAFGLMLGSEIVLPKFQFVTDGKEARLVEGLVKITKLFDDSGAGRWSMLQFLIDADPNLADTPQRILADGRVGDVVTAAKAYLGLDEG